MAGLLKERARKPIIATDVGIANPSIKHIDAVTHYVAEIREPWSRDGYQTFQLVLTETEMLTIVSDWMATLARKDRP